MVHAEPPDRSRDRPATPSAADEVGAGPSDPPSALPSDELIEPPTGPPARAIDRFRSGVLGSVTAAALLGLRDALEGRRDERPAIERPAPRPLEEDDAFELHLEPGSPEQSYVVFRRPDPPPED